MRRKLSLFTDRAFLLFRDLLNNQGDAWVNLPFGARDLIDTLEIAIILPLTHLSLHQVTAGIFIDAQSVQLVLTDGSAVSESKDVHKFPSAGAKHSIFKAAAHLRHDQRRHNGNQEAHDQEFDQSES